MKPPSLLNVLCTVATLFAVAGCMTAEREVVVNAGDSTPLRLRDNARPYDAMPDHSPIVAYEVGRCESDADCAPRGCSDAVCSPEGGPSLCVTDPVGQCLAQVPRSSCMCNEGVCRWRRDAAVLQCSTEAIQQIQTRPLPGTPNEPYPVPPHY